METISKRKSQTKIIATLGPASDNTECLLRLLEAGVDVFRLNSAHSSTEAFDQTLEKIAQASEITGRYVATLLDLAGPKIRLGKVPNDEIYLSKDSLVGFVRGDEAASEGSEECRGSKENKESVYNKLTVSYDKLLDEVKVGDKIMMADGTVSVSVETVTKDHVECHVIQAGTIRSRQGVNLPGVKLSVSCLGPKDRAYVEWAATRNIDYIGLSFVRSADDVKLLRDLLASLDSDIQIVAKIEKPEALQELEQIVEAADAVMVARGDLGLEIDIAKIAVVQKEIISVCQRLGKPVIIATQMLDSMQHSSLPTRAEVTDVANAVLDGADVCMLSGETAIGRYPVESVEMMQQIALSTDAINSTESKAECFVDDQHSIDPITELTVRSAGQLAESLDAKILVVVTRSGLTTLSLSKKRFSVPAVSIAADEKILRRMCLYWGVIPLFATHGSEDTEALSGMIINWGKKHGHLSSGDRIVIIGGTGISKSAHNQIVVYELD